jgi:tetratricopeptide (TPR) repeat protein
MRQAAPPTRAPPLPSIGMSARARIRVAVAAIAAVAATGVVAIAALATDRPEADAVASVPVRREGAPPLVLDVGLRTDAEAVALRRAEQLYQRGQRAEAGAIFRRFDSLEGKVGAAFADWPNGTLDRVQQLGGLHARSALVQLHLGLVLYWEGRSGATDAWAAAAASEPDTRYATKANDLLHPQFPVPGLPQFIPGFAPPRAITSLPASDQLGALRAAARTGGVQAKLLYGIGLQRVGRPISARRAFAAAAAAAPNDAEAQVADAVGRFAKADPTPAFSRLGPLTKRFPHRATVRFHLGLLLLWSGEVESAKRQFRLAERAEPESLLSRAARTYLDRLR